MTKIELANIMNNAEHIQLSNGTDEIIIRKEDISNEFLALANGFNSIGGGVNILQTYDLRSVVFDISEYPNHYAFYAWAMQFAA